MKKLNCVHIGLLVLLLAAGLSSVAMASPSMTLIPALVKPSPMMPVAEQLGAQLQSLVTPLPATPAEGDENNQEPPPTFGTRALNVVINVTEILRGQAVHFVTDFAALPQFSDWLTQQRSDPRLVARWQSIGSDILSTAGVAFIGAVVLELLLYPLRRMLRRRLPHGFAARLAVVISLFCLRAVPIIVFVATSVTLLNQFETQKLSRFLIMNVVYALALARTMVSFLRGVLSPKSDSLRFVPASTGQAVYGFRWLRAFGLLIIVGYFCMIVARAVRVPESAVAVFINLLGLVLVVMSVIVIVQIRAFVALLLRGNLSVAQQDLSWFDSLRLWFARHWSGLAISYLVIGYAIAATGVQDGLVLMLRGTLLTLLVLVAARLLFREIGLWEMRSKKGSTAFYALIKGAFLRVTLVVLTLAGGLAAWGVDLATLVATPIGHRLLGSAFSIGTTFFVLGLVYEFFSSAVDRQLTPRKKNGEVVEVNARTRTLLPMMRNALFIVVAAIFAIVAMSEAGINIGPLLAGAGVLGVAVGFGSQTLVKDFLTGLFIVVENTIAVGDVIKLGDHSGVVETMSMRTMRLRDFDGALHIVPFSEVSKVSNLSKSFAYAVFKVNVTLATDLERAMECMRTVDEDMRRDPEFKPIMLEPLENMGVDSINDASITLMARVRTLPGKQWKVRRMFLLRLKQRFDKDGIELPSWTSVRVGKEDV